MKEVTKDLDDQKEQREKDLEENNSLRLKIAEIIDQYKTKEAAYKEEITEYQKIVVQSQEET